MRKDVKTLSLSLLPTLSITVSSNLLPTGVTLLLAEPLCAAYPCISNMILTSVVSLRPAQILPAARRHMYKLLRCTCLHCFALKMDADEAGRYRRRLELLAQGRLVEAAEQVSGGGAAAAKVLTCSSREGWRNPSCGPPASQYNASLLHPKSWT